MFIATGTLDDGTDYTLVWRDGGDMEGSGAAIAEVLGLVGATVGVTPTGPFIEVAQDDARSVLAALSTVGVIRTVDGDAPVEQVVALPEGATP